MKAIWIVILSFGFLLSCNTEEDSLSVMHELPPFDKIVVSNPFNIVLEESAEFNVEVTGAGKFVNEISFEVIDSVLHVTNNSHSTWLSPKDNKIELHINSEPLNELQLKAPCSISTLNPITSNEFGIGLSGKSMECTLDLNCNVFYYWDSNPGSGKLTLAGNAQLLKVWSHSNLFIDAQQLNAVNAIIESNSGSRMNLMISNQLKYSLRGTGDIHLYGSTNTIIEVEKSSTGDLIQH